MHPQLARSFALVAVILLQNSEYEALLKFPNSLRIEDSTFVHLHYECFKLILHSLPFLDSAHKLSVFALPVIL